MATIRIQKKYKKTICKFCDGEITSKHFARHLQRNHIDENEVKLMFAANTSVVTRRSMLMIIRNEGNLDSALRGHIIPKKRPLHFDVDNADFAICIHCKGYYKRLSLSRHMKKCFAKVTPVNETTSRPLINSLIYSACKKKFGDVLNKLTVKKEIFSRMQADIVTSVALEDPLILFFGEDLLKKTKNKRSTYHISNKLRECAKLLLEMRNLGPYSDFISILKPVNFDDIIEATKNISKYEVTRRCFGAPSLALHLGTTLKKMAELSEKLILRKKIPLPINDVEKTLTDLKRIKKLIESQWTTELGSLALKDLNEKSAIKPKLLPVTEDIMKLTTFLEQTANICYEQLINLKSIEEYKVLVETTLILTILHNRKRVGDIQYLELSSYREQHDKAPPKENDFLSTLTENEKVLTQHYKKIVAIGKGSRPVTILIPKKIQKFYTLIFNLRNNTAWFLPENNYFFTYPKSTRWIDGCAVIRKYAKKSGVKHPELLTSSRLRKHIATVTQLLSLKTNEIEQLAKFMGHTVGTHQTFYK